MLEYSRYIGYNDGEIAQYVQNNLIDGIRGIFCRRPEACKKHCHEDSAFVSDIENVCFLVASGRYAGEKLFLCLLAAGAADGD